MLADTERNIRVESVFGRRSGANPLSYILRPVENSLRTALAESQYEAIVVYGSSKSGKSSLLRSVLPADRCTFVQATDSLDRTSLYNSILNRAGAIDTLVSLDETTDNVTRGFSLSPANWFGFKKERTRGKRAGGERRGIPLDYRSTDAVVQRYIDAAGSKPIVIDNFHYIRSTELQSSIATDIRVFAEAGVKVILIGTWSGQNYILRRNRDLSGRVLALSIEPWTDEELGAVATKGASVLNLSLTDSVLRVFERSPAGSVSVLQDAARQYLHSLGIHTRVDQTRRLSEEWELREAFRKKSDSLKDDTADTLRALTKFGGKDHYQKSLLYWILVVFLRQSESGNSEGVKTSRLVELLADSGISATQQDIEDKIGASFIEWQHTEFQTPLMALNESNGRLCITDAETLFTVRRHRKELLEALSA